MLLHLAIIQSGYEIRWEINMDSHGVINIRTTI